ncbi:glycosyltransferase family A protein [Sulfurovum sp.]|uniref:glycosyltransferase family 2 protein n=1 Tax=Sulfurovum sp. TaxID=1969726 RepID=UPI002629E0F2|nr:glycosyltransferase family A protein [Sulfurovum sp.]
MTKDMLPTVSIIIPTFNREKYLAEAIESIINQNDYPIEIIVIDDGSTDNTKAIMQQYTPLVQYFYQKNMGQAAARNRGIDIARGEYLAFLDSDDLWTPKKLKLQMDYMIHNPDVKMVFGHVKQFTTKEYKSLHSNIISQIMPGLVLGTLLIRKKDFLEIGYLNTKLQVGEFIEWFDRAKREKCTYHILEEVLLKRRLHDSNLGLQKKTGPNDFAKILRESLRQKRIDAKLNENGAN